VYALDQSILFFKGMELKDAKARAWEENPEPEPQWTTGSVRSAAIKKIAWEPGAMNARVPWIRVVARTLTRTFDCSAKAGFSRSRRRLATSRVSFVSTSR